MRLCSRRECSNFGQQPPSLQYSGNREQQSAATRKAQTHQSTGIPGARPTVPEERRAAHPLVSSQAVIESCCRDPEVRPRTIHMLPQTIGSLVPSFDQEYGRPHAPDSRYIAPFPRCKYLPMGEMSLPVSDFLRDQSGTHSSRRHEDLCCQCYMGGEMADMSPYLFNKKRKKALSSKDMSTYS